MNHAWVGVASTALLFGVAAAVDRVQATNIGEKNIMVVQSQTERAGPARSGDIAILEELTAARATNTPAAYDLFLARHSNHPLSIEATAERDRLIKSLLERTPN